MQLFPVEEVFLGRQLACAERQEQQQAGGGGREDVQQGHTDRIVAGAYVSNLAEKV